MSNESKVTISKKMAKKMTHEDRTRGFRIERKNVNREFFNDNYYRLVRLAWHHLIGFTFLGYVLINVLFGILYFMFREQLNPPTLNLWGCFIFSVHTLSTVGYGNVAPVGWIADTLTVVETFTGLVLVAVITGLFFSKFSRPSAKFIFADKLLVTKNNGQPVIMFRVANERSNRVMDADLTLTVLYNETTTEGITYRRFADLKLERPKTPVFVLSLTGIHKFEPASFTGDTLEKIRNKENIEFLVSIRGLDDTFGQVIHATKLYGNNDIHWGGQFADILELKPDGTRVIDFEKFHAVNH